MKSKWIKGTPAELIAETMQLLSINSDGRVGYQIAAEFFFDGLFGLIEHHHLLDNNTAFRLFRQSILNVYAAKKSNEHNRILTEFDKLCHTQLNDKQFTLVTTIQLKNIYTFPQFHTNECRIKITNSLPKKYLKSRTRALQEQQETIEDHTDLAYAIIFTNAKSPESAVAKANDALAILSGLMQLGFKKNINFFAISNEGKYPSKLAIDQGKLQTLHLRSGSCHQEAIWINTDYEPRQPTSLKNYKNTISHTQKRFRQIARLTFSDHVEKALLNYSNALASKDTELRFLKLWVAIEQLLATDDTETLIRRLSFFYRETHLQRSILRSLRLARNHHIHGGKRPTNIELKLFQLCRFFEHALQFFISNPFRYKTAEDAIAFISLNTEAENIQSQIKKLKSVLKFVS
ncbi:hypothetical protein [Pseudomonas sp. SIMBA_068]|uniref:hypothetical protein n=1 Tax=Pseudomonas sp. SIMBA_068 TaxID=3085808 RepID=UPI00397DB368